jgi:protein involved in polysaccharide export with SLBB domain
LTSATSKRASFVLLLALATLGAAGAVRAQSVDPAALPESIRRALGGEAVNAPTADPSSLPPTLADGPVDPARYRLGPGDELLVYYRGKTTATHRLVVGPEGQAWLPDVGRIPLTGKTLDEGRAAVRAAAARILRDVSVDVELTRIRAFKVTVTGEVTRPGVYAATGATRLFEVLRLAGGVSDSAALRSIQFVDTRTGAVTTADLLPFLLAGRPESNPYLPDGATIVVPRRARTVDVAGAVLHPGRYDLPPSGTTVGELLALLGIAPDADTSGVEHARPGGPGAPPVVERGGLPALAVRSLGHGDRLQVARRQGMHHVPVVVLDGEVRLPGTYALGGTDMDVAALIERAGGFTDRAGRARVLLARRAPSDTLTAHPRRLAPFPNVTLTLTEREWLRSRGVDGRYAVVVDLAAEGATGPALVDGDRLFVPERATYVAVMGRVRSPGFYPWRDGATARDYVDMAGGYADRADRKQTRVGAGPGDNFRTAKDAGSPAPGDQVWVPEKTPRSGWETVRDALLVVGQLATIILLIDQLQE